jgi:hypothetical protein
MSTRLSSWSAADVAARLSKSGKGRSKKSGDGWMAPCPAHDDRTPSLSLKNNSEGRLLWHCFGGCEAEDVKRALIAVLGGEEAPSKGEGEPRQKEKVEDPRKVVYPVPADARFGIEDFQHSTYGSPSRVWTYKLPGDLIGGWIARYDLGDGEKEVLPFTWSRNEETGAEKVRMKSMPAPRPLYNLDRIVANPDATIVIAEGEKAADAAEKLFPEWVATAIPGGSNAVRLADLSALANRTVVLMPDHDAPGYDFALKLIGAMPNSADLRFMVWPPRWPSADGGETYVMGKGDDADDHVAAGWTTEKLRQAVKENGGTLCHRIHYLPESEFEPRQYVDNKPS